MPAAVTQSQEKAIIIRAIADLGHRVTAADIASHTGLPLATSTSQLNTIAAEAGGHLEVSTAGDIAYRFKNNFQTTYLATGLRAFFAKVWDKLFAVGFFLLKISFGLFLIFSLAIVITAFTVIAVLSAALGSKREDLNLRELLQFFNLLMWRDLLFWGQSHVRARIRKQQTQKQNDRGNFFINCFSFLFGQGDPNKEIEEERWKLTAQAIRDNGGVVIKEQLAPYLDSNLEDDESILPVLARFDGRPVVTRSGNIAYVFPSLQVTTDIEKHRQADGDSLPTAAQGSLEEKKWTFSNLSREALKPVYVAAGLNLFGTWWLYFVFNRMFLMHLVWTQVLVVYATLFLVLPGIRYLAEADRNRHIAGRNLQRQKAASLVNNPDQEMQNKLAERGEYAGATHLRSVQPDHLAYTTAEETLEQQFVAQKTDEETKE